MFVKSFVKPVYPTDWGKFSKWCCSDYCTMYLSVKKVNLDLLLMPSRFLSSPPDRGKLLIAQQAVFFFLFEHLCQSKKVSLDLLLMPSTFLSSLSGRGKLLIPQQAVKICFHENLFPLKQKRAWNYVGTVEPVLCSVNKKKNHSVKQVKWRFFKK